MQDVEILSPDRFAALDAGVDIDEAERRVERIAWLMDSALRIPGTGIRFGADSVIGLVPGIGDAVAFGISAYIVAEAHRLGAPERMLGKMAGNVALDAIVGSVPLLGDLFDVAFKANRRNVEMLRGHIRDLRAERATPVGGAR